MRSSLEQLEKTMEMMRRMSEEVSEAEKAWRSTVDAIVRGLPAVEAAAGGLSSRSGPQVLRVNSKFEEFFARLGCAGAVKLCCEVRSAGETRGRD
jgi:hypothetical protein